MTGKVLFVVALLASACAPEVDYPSTAAVGTVGCTPGETAACTCGREDGTRTCSDEGVLGACDCQGQGGLQPQSARDAGAEGGSSLCGNGRVELGEACDDKNRIDGDGCSAKCQPDGSPRAGDTCPGQSVTLWSNRSVRLIGTTATYGDDHSASCWQDARGPDRVYALKPQTDGQLRITAAFPDPDFRPVLSIREVCAEPITRELTCALGYQSRPIARSVPVKGKTTYYLFVDGEVALDSGAFDITLELK